MDKVLEIILFVYNVLLTLVVTPELTLALLWLGRLLNFPEVAIPVCIYTEIYFTLPLTKVISNNHPFSCSL